MYGVETKVLKQQVRRNSDRFPHDFMFELTENEFSILRSQIVTSSWGGIRYLPMVSYLDELITKQENNPPRKRIGYKTDEPNSN